MHRTHMTTAMRRLLLRPRTTSSPRRQQQCPPAAAFCSSLAAGLAHLDSFSPDDDGGSGGGSPPPPPSVLPVRWCADAMRLVKRMQRNIKARFDGEGDGEEWLPDDLENYMEEAAALLDLCNALKSAAARLRRRCMAADFAAAAAGGVDEEERAEVRELREAAEMLGSVVDQVFDELIRGRNEMLGVLRDKALSLSLTLSHN